MSSAKNVKLEIRSIGSPDVELETWTPSAVSEVKFLIELEIGESGVEGADLFQAVIATPEGLRANANNDFTISDRATIIISWYEWQHVRKLLDILVQSCESDSWVTSVLNLQKYFQWEYENYQLEE